MPGDPDRFRSVLDRISDRWSMDVIGLLGRRSYRFTELQLTLPDISRPLLTVVLRGLENDGLVTRTVYAEVPPRVDYAVTDLGQSLAAAVQVLTTWAATHQETIARNRAGFGAILDD